MGRGFTLIELVIVIAIIGLITSIALPNYAAIQNKAKESSLRTLGHSLQVSLESYFLSKGSYPAGTDVNLVDLMSTLAAEGSFTQQPKNPYTGKTFTAGDPSGKIIYSLDSAAQAYTLTVYGAGNEAVLFALKNI